MFAIRPIADADWPAVERIQRECYPPSAVESLACLRSLAEVSPTTCLVASSGTEIAAYLLAHPWRSDDLPPLDAPLSSVPSDTLFIHDLALLPVARGAGLANRMVLRLVDAAQDLDLHAASLLSVQGTVEFWKRFGFVERPDLTARFHDAVIAFYHIDFEFMTAKILRREAAEPMNTRRKLSPRRCATRPHLSGGSSIDPL